MAAGSAAERAEAKGRASARKRGREVSQLDNALLSTGVPVHVPRCIVCPHLHDASLLCCGSFCSSRSNCQLLLHPVCNASNITKS